MGMQDQPWAGREWFVAARSALFSPKDHMNIRILQTMITGITLILSLGARM